MEITLGAWIPLGSAATTPDGRLRLPVPPAGPGLYRFLLTAPAPSVYIGETEELRRRFGQYANPGPSQRTNLRMNARMREVLAAGGTVAVETCTDASVAIATCLEPLDLLMRSHRLLAEESALAGARATALGTIENAGG
jgi:hypothetical protein